MTFKSTNINIIFNYLTINNYKLLLTLITNLLYLIILLIIILSFYLSNK